MASTFNCLPARRLMIPAKRQGSFSLSPFPPLWTEREWKEEMPVHTSVEESRSDVIVGSRRKTHCAHATNQNVRFFFKVIRIAAQE